MWGSVNPTVGIAVHHGLVFILGSRELRGRRRGSIQVSKRLEQGLAGEQKETRGRANN